MSLAMTDSPLFSVGSSIVLTGLSKAELNGTRGTVLATPAATAATRLRVRYLHPTTGELTVSAIKPVNLAAALDGEGGEEAAAPSDDPEVVEQATAMVQRMIAMMTQVFQANQGRSPSEEEVREMLNELTPERIEEMMSTPANPELAAAFTSVPPAVAAPPLSRRLAQQTVATSIAAALISSAAAAASASASAATPAAAAAAAAPPAPPVTRAESDAFFGFSGAADEERNLWVLASDGELDRVRELLAADPTLTPNSFDPNGYSPMHAAASYSHVALMRWLLANGGECSLADGDGDTPLHVVEGVEVARLLIAHGADPLAINIAGETPRAKAIEEENDELAAYFLLQEG